MRKLNLSTQQACAAQHFGLWAVEPNWFNQAVAMIRSGVFVPYAANKVVTDENEDVMYSVADGIAHLSIVGQMAKGKSSFGGASTVLVRQGLRMAVADKSVKAIMLHIDSPGGTTAGTGALADDVKRADAIKPVYAHIEDLAASAAYWVAAQARRVTAEPGSLVGSIGTYAYVVDTSGAFEKNGWKAHVISSGGYKGAFSDGTEITKEQLDTLQTIVDDANAHFLNAVASGRRLSAERVKELGDGRVHDAAKAKTLGLIDDVAHADDVMTMIASTLQNAQRTSDARRAAAVSLARVSLK